MGNTRDTGYLRNLVTYDGSGNITLPANLTVTGTITGYATTSYVGTQLSGYAPTTRTLTINGTAYDLSADRSWTITSMIYPTAGISVSTGSAWGTSITDNSANWNTAFGWGNHASATYATQTYVGTQIANLVASAPATLDTLNELAAALGNDAAFSTTISTALGNRLRVDINTQGLSATLQGYGRTNLGLGTAAVSATGDFAAASHTHSIANVIGLQTALDSKVALTSLSFVAGSGAYNNTTGVITIPTNNTQITNGAGYITGITSGNVTTALGYTPVTNARTITINGTGYDLSADRSFTVSASDATKLPLTGGTITGTLSMATTGTNYIRMGVFPNSTSNSGEAWIGRASDRNAGTMTVQLGGASATSRSFEVVDYAWSTVLFSVGSNGNINSSGTITASNFSGTHSGSSSGTNTGDQTTISGNAATATVLSTGRTNYKGVTDGVVVGELMWKNYGNSHTIFDASNGTAPGGSAVNRHTPQNPVATTDGSNSWGVNPNLMGWNGSSTFGVKVDWSRYAESAGSAGSAPNGSNANAYYNVTPGTAYGLKFWSSDSYKISMGASGLYQYGPVTDYSIKMQMDDGSAGRGFTWGRESYAPIAGLNGTSGNMQIAGNFRVGSNVYIDANYGCTITGTYASTRYQGIWNMGTSWYMPQDGTTPGNLYGLAWSHPNAGGQASYLATHGLLVMENGNTNSAISNGIWTRGDVTAYSDARVKENVEVITNAIERIKAIRGVTFTRNDREDKTTRFAGVIAQEVLAVLPEVVTEDALGTYSVAYGNLAGLFIEAIKEQQKEIDELKTLINGITK